MRRYSLLVALLVFSSQLFAQAIDAARIDSIVEEARNEFGAPGIAVAIVRGNETIYMKGFGVRKIGTDLPVTPDTRFALASTTKAFTTTAMAILVDEGKMDWDDPVRKYLPTFRLADSLADQNVTLRDIVSHRTGLSRNDQLWYNTVWSRDEILRRIALVPLARQFRSVYQYQNIMFLAAGQAVGAASGGTWEKFVAARILQPLGMTNTGFSPADLKQVQDVATPHVRKGDVAVVTPWKDITNIGPAGSMNSSVRDMTKWVSFQLAGGTVNGKRIVSEKQLNETRLPQMAIRDDESTRDLNPDTNLAAYGLGWRLADYRGQHMVSHAGAIDGFRAQVALLPKQNLGIVILCNLGVYNLPEALRYALIDELLQLEKRDWNKLYLEQAQKAEREARKRIAEREAKRAKESKPSHALAAYAGTFDNAGYGRATVVSNGERLTLVWGAAKLSLSHHQYDTFESHPDDAISQTLVQFHLDTKGDVASLEFLGQRFVRAAPEAH